VRQLWIRDLDSLAAHPLPGTERAGVPIWSPDGRSIAFQSGSKLYRVDLSGGAPQAICDAATVVGGAWGKDGTIIIGTTRGLMQVPVSGGTPSRIDGLPAGEFSQQFPSFLPDGRHFLYIFRNGTSPSWNSRIGSLDAAENRGPSQPLLSGNGIYVPPSGSSGEQIVFQQKNGALVAQPFDRSRQQMQGAPIPIADAVADFTVSPNVLAYTTPGTVKAQLTWFDRKGRKIGTVGEPGMLFPRPVLSPDDRTVAVSRTDPSTGGADIWLYDVARGTASRFTFNDRAMVAAWSPDGSHLAYSSAGSGAYSIYQKPMSGLGREELLDKGTENSKFAMDYSRDGRYLVEGVSTGNQDSVSLLQLSAPGAGEVKPVPFSDPGVDAINPSVSPNGQWIAYDSDKSGRDEIYVETFPARGGFWQVSAEGGSSPVWSRDGKELYFISADGRLMAVAVRSGAGGAFEAGAPQPLFNPHMMGYGRASKFAVSKDGRFLFPVWIEQSEAHPITVVVNWQASLRK
jgi:Tol biopolymer transport system component